MRAPVAILVAVLSACDPAPPAPPAPPPGVPPCADSKCVGPPAPSPGHVDDGKWVVGNPDGGVDLR